MEVLSRLVGITIGSRTNSLYWIEANKKTDGRIIALGKVKSKQQYYELLKSADLYIGTFPLASYMAMMDAVQVGLPFLQLQVMTQENTTWGIDAKEDESVLWPRTLKDLSLSIEKAVCDDRFYILLQKESQRWLLEYSSSDRWKKRMKKLYQICPQVHKLHIFGDNKNVRINDECLTSNLLQGTNDFYYVNKFLNVLAKKLLYISIK